MGWLPAPNVTEPLPKRVYRKRARALRQALMELQNRLRENPMAVVVLVGGVDGGGKGETVNLLNEWLDPRWIRTRAFDEPTDEEEQRPAFWRYWRSLPPRGSMAFFLSAWYSAPLQERVDGGEDDDLKRQLDQIRNFEHTLVSDGIAVFKFWLHLDREAQLRRLEELASDPERSWRVGPSDWVNAERYDEFVAATEEILEGTHTREAPWTVVDGAEPHRRALEVGDALDRLLHARLARPDEPTGLTRIRDLADDVDDDDEDPESSTGDPVSKEQARQQLEVERNELGHLHRKARAEGIPLIAVFEGRDASGKGGAIRRVVSGLDVRRVDIARIGPPTETEREHHYLRRFWQRVPRAGYVTLFDRSWYGRVLVERVEELASRDTWMRAYDEINDFEHQLVAHGTVIAKFWMDVSRDEQERRFEERRRLAHKRWKLTDDDLRNRARWDDYEEAIQDMLARTKSPVPWSVIPADDKRSARLHVLQDLNQALRARLEGS